MVSNYEDNQQTVRSKVNPIDRTWTRNTPSVKPYDISDDEYTTDTPE